MPGSACRRSSASPLTERRSTTSSTVKPRTRLPPPTSSTTVVPPLPPPSPPPSPGGSGGAWRSARPPSTTVTRVPRTLTNPATTGGAPGIRVGTSRGRISRTRSASAAQTRLPTRNTSSRTTPASLIRSEETKILQGVALSKQSRVGGPLGERWNEVGGPLRAQHQPRAGHRMGQREQSRVQQLPGRERLDPLGSLARRRGHAAAAPGCVLAVADHGMAHVREMHADLVGATGLELHPHQIDVREARHDAHARYRVATPGQDRHALAVAG